MLSHDPIATATCVGGPLHGQRQPMAIDATLKYETVGDVFVYRRAVFTWGAGPVPIWVPQAVTDQAVIQMFGSEHLREIAAQPREGTLSLSKAA